MSYAILPNEGGYTDMSWSYSTASDGAESTSNLSTYEELSFTGTEGNLIPILVRNNGPNPYEVRLRPKGSSGYHAMSLDAGGYNVAVIKAGTGGKIEFSTSTSIAYFYFYKRGEVSLI